jgi:cytochrome P450
MFEMLTGEASRNPYPIYAQLRAAMPVAYDPQKRVCALFEYEAVKRALTDHETFSSRAPQGGAPALWLIFTDPPRHARLRGLISKAFTPRSVAELEPRIRALSQELAARMSPDSGVELVSEFALPLPMMVIAELLGAPTEDWRSFRKWGEAMLGLIGTLGSADAAARAVRTYSEALGEMQPYVAALLAQRRAAPRDDVLTRLAQAAWEGERLTEEEIVAFFQLLLVAGHETTTNLIGSLVLTLIEDDELQRRVRQEPGVLPSVIEEVMRLRSPVQLAFRVTTRDVELSGRQIPGGTLTLVMIGSANRDPKQFSEPDRLDLSRSPNPHLAFGHGIHFCIGAPLARLEARIALTELLGRFSHLALGEGGWMPRDSFHVHGPARLMLRTS